MGCQTVDFLAKKGIAVTLVEMTEAIAADMEPDDRNFIAQKMIEYDVDIHLGARAERLVPGKGLLVSKESGQELIEADTVVLALGFLPNRDLIGSLDIKENTVSINGKNAEIYLIGDCKEPRKILEAVHEGAEVGLRI